MRQSAFAALDARLLHLLDGAHNTCVVAGAFERIFAQPVPQRERRDARDVIRNRGGTSLQRSQGDSRATERQLTAVSVYGQRNT